MFSLVSHSCRSFSTRVALASLVSHSCRTRVALVALVSIVSGTRVVKQTRSEITMFGNILLHLAI